MKSLKEINLEIQDILNVDRNRIEKKELNKMKVRLKYLRVVRDYLLTEPTEEFMKKEKQRLINRLDKIREGQPKKEAKDALREYNNVMGVKDIQRHLKTIRFILN